MSNYALVLYLFNLSALQVWTIALFTFSRLLVRGGGEGRLTNNYKPKVKISQTAYRNKPAGQAAGADPFRCNSIRQNSPLQQNCCNF